MWLATEFPTSPPVSSEALIAWRPLCGPVPVVGSSPGFDAYPEQDDHARVCKNENYGPHPDGQMLALGWVGGNRVLIYSALGEKVRMLSDSKLHTSRQAVAALLITYCTVCMLVRWRNLPSLVQEI